MKRKMKMLILLGVLVVCAGAYLGVQLLQTETAPVTEAAGTYALDSHTADAMQALAWTQDGESLRFTCADGVWSVADDPAFPLNQADVQAMAADLLALTGTRRLEGVTDPDAYGLTEPVFSVTASWADGTSTTWSMGDETPFQDGYYLAVGDTSTIYTVEEDITTFFDTPLKELAVLETLPAAENVTRLTVQGSASLDILREQTSRTINESELWYDAQTGLALDTAEADDLVSDAKSIDWEALEEATASDEELTAFGVDEAAATTVTLYEGETAVRTLLIGSQNDSGSYYARLPGSTMVYTVTADSVSSLLTARADSMPSMELLDLPGEQVQTAVLTAGELVYTWTPAAADAEQPETQDAPDADTPDAEAADSEEAAEDPGAALWDDLLALSAQSSLDASDGVTLLRVEVTARSGQTAELIFAEHDAQSYAVTVQDRCCLVDAAPVDAIIRTLRTITP